MKKKVILFLVVLLFLCGCDVKYNVIINDNLSIEENATVVENESNFYNTTLKDNYIATIYSPYKSTVEGANYQIIDYRKEEYSGKYLSHSFADVSSYVNNTIFYTHYWPGFLLVENNNLVTIKSSGDFININMEDNNEEGYSTDNDTGSYTYNIVDDCEITFTLPYKVTDSTADSCSVSKDKYICIWHINANDDNISFSLTFDKSIKVSDIKDNNNTTDDDNNTTTEKDTDSYNTLIIVGLILLIVGLVVIIVLVFNYKEKKDLKKQERGY